MPDIWMDVDIAVQIPVNIMPLIDPTDFKTIEDNIAYDEAGMAVAWNFVTTDGFMTTTAVTPTTSGTHDWFEEGANQGMYSLVIPASGGTVDNDTEGIGWITGETSNCLPFRGPTVGFRAAAINDALIDSDTLIDNADNQLLYESTIDTVTSQVEFIMDVAFAQDDAWNGSVVSLEDVSTGEVYSGGRWITDGVASTESLHVNLAFPVTVVAGDKIRIYAERHPTYALELYGTAKTSGVNSILAKLLAYVQLIVRKDAAIATDNSSELTEINADGGSGAGGYVSTSDATQSIRDEIVIAQISNNAIKAKTDDLTFTVANVVDANLTNVAGGTDIKTSGTGGQKHGNT